MIISRLLTNIEKQKEELLWEEQTTAPFNQFIVSWNGERPLKGAYEIQVKLYQNQWSPWIDYAYWGSCSQYSFKDEVVGHFICRSQDILSLFNGTASGFQVRIRGHLNRCRGIMISLFDSSTYELQSPIQKSFPVHLAIPGLSQFSIPLEHNGRICSPIATTAVIRYLLNHPDLSPHEFIDQVWDSTHDLYGNWVFACAQASHILGENWRCYVDHCTSFDSVLIRLYKGFPTIASIQGPLTGSAKPYLSGHLLVIKGYDPARNEILCMDPAFPTDDLTHTRYAWNDFMQAWQRRKGLAYVFEPIKAQTRLEIHTAKQKNR